MSPRSRLEWAVRSNLAHHPVWERLDLVVVSRPPYLVFAEVNRKEKDDTLARRRAERDAGLVHAAYESFHREIGSPLGLPREDEIPDVHRVLVAVRLEHYPRFSGQPPPPPLARARYWIVLIVRFAKPLSFDRPRQAPAL